MNTIPAREIKRRGISAVDDALQAGPVQVIQRDELRYVVLSVDQYEELKAAYDEVVNERLRAVQEDLASGRFKRMTASELIDDLGREE